jgi:8-oxo-dGTP pyrophosphatase MutT (NUDIX family)
VPGAPDPRGRCGLRRAGRADLSRAALAESLRAALLSPAQAEDIDVHGSKDAAVLAPLYLDAEGALHGVFTRRRHDLPHHPGEIAFPGGRAEPQDADLRATALREAHEEIGLPPEAVEVVGALRPTPTFVTSYSIYPYVGVIEPGFAWLVQDAEVADVLELPMTAVRAGYARRRLVRRGIPIRTTTYEVDGNVIWGATARIVGDLLERLGPWLNR